MTLADKIKAHNKEILYIDAGGKDKEAYSAAKKLAWKTYKTFMRTFATEILGFKEFFVQLPGDAIFGKPTTIKISKDHARGLHVSLSAASSIVIFQGETEHMFVTYKQWVPIFAEPQFMELVEAALLATPWFLSPDLVEGENNGL